MSSTCRDKASETLQPRWKSTLISSLSRVLEAAFSSRLISLGSRYVFIRTHRGRRTVFTQFTRPGILISTGLRQFTGDEPRQDAQTLFLRVFAWLRVCI